MATETRKKIVPLVSSGTAGPLGVVHLPRLWLKLSLAAAGALPEGYDECGEGFDAMTLNTLDSIAPRRSSTFEPQSRVT